MIYKYEDLKYLQDFDQEHEKVIKNVTNEANIVRYILLAIDIMLISLKLYAYGLQPKYLAQWFLFFNALSKFLSIRAANNLNFKNDINAQCIHHLVYTIILTLAMNGLAYWPLAYPYIREQYRDDAFVLMEQQITHSIPGVTCLINAYITPCVLYRPFVKVYFNLGSLYILSNFLTTKI